MRKISLYVLPLLLAVAVFYFASKPSSPTSHASQTTEITSQKLSEAYEVARVINGKSFVLKNGKTVRLASIQVPNIQETKGKKRAGEPLGEEAKKALADLLKKQKVRLQFAPEKEDDKGRWIALAYLEDGTNVQEALISQGWAITYPFTDLRGVLSDWLEEEDEAREDEKGIWKNDFWKPKQADAPALKNSTQYSLVEGTVQRVTKVKKNWYLDFGADWKTDFTAAISLRDAETYFPEQDLTEYKGKQLRVRGWLHSNHGPAMEINQPEQIEVLD